MGLLSFSRYSAPASDCIVCIGYAYFKLLKNWAENWNTQSCARFYSAAVRIGR
jgi:hypothetical protein